MSVSKSRQAYPDCYKVWDAAIENSGARLRMDSYDHANHFRMRMHYARVIDREDNKALFEPGHKMYDASLYDAYTVRIKKVGEDFYIYVEPVTGEIGEPEPIPPEDSAKSFTPEPEPSKVTIAIEPISRRV